MKGFIQVGEISIRCEPNGRYPRQVTDKQILIGIAHITSVRPATQDFGNSLVLSGTKVEYIGDAGYHTKCSFVSENFEIVRALIEEAT